MDVHLPDASRRIRFQLSPLNYGDWRDADDELRADAYGVDWVFGPGVVITRELSGRGHCLRVGCETNGGERVVRIAATTDTRRSPDWTPLDDCMLSPSGITSPLLEKVRIAAPHPQPAAFPVQGTLLFTLHTDKSVPNDSPFAAEGRRLVVADVKPAESPVVRSLLSLPADTALPPAENVYKVRGVARLLVHESQGWAVQADRFVRLDAHAAERSGLRRSGHTVEEGKRDQTASKKPAEPEARAERVATETTRRDTTPEAPTVDVRPARPWSELVLAVREALAQAAHLRATTTWKTLVRTVGPELGELAMDDRDRLLVEVDAPLRTDAPILSALIRDGGAPPLYLPTVLDLLGVPHAARSSQIKRWAVVESERAYAAYDDPPRTMRERLALRPEMGSHWAGRPLLSGAQSAESRRIHTLVAQLEELRPKMSQQTLNRVDNAVQHAQRWLAARPSPDDAKSLKKLRRSSAPPSARSCVSGLEKVLKSAREDLKAAEWLERYEKAQQTRESAQPAAKATQPQPGTTPSKPKQSAVERLTRQLIQVALEQSTIAVLDLEDGRTKPDHVIRQRLSQVDRGVTDEVPLLSALVTDGEGRPAPFFRAVLQDTGFSVPRNDEVLFKVWRREQERAHAAYANPPRRLPDRLVPRA